MLSSDPVSPAQPEKSASRTLLVVNPGHDRTLHPKKNSSAAPRTTTAMKPVLNQNWRLPEYPGGALPLGGGVADFLFLRSPPCWPFVAAEMQGRCSPRPALSPEQSCHAREVHCVPDSSPARGPTKQVFRCPPRCAAIPLPGPLHAGPECRAFTRSPRQRH